MVANRSAHHLRCRRLTKDVLQCCSRCCSCCVPSRIVNESHCVQLVTHCYWWSFWPFLTGLFAIRNITIDFCVYRASLLEISLIPYDEVYRRWRFVVEVTALDRWTYQRSYSTLRPVNIGMGDRLWVGIPPRYVISHPGQLSLAIPPRVGAMSTGDGFGHR